MASPVAAAAVGLVAGMLSGAFGVGGGVVTTPAIRLLLGYPALIAVGTPLPVIIPTAIAGAWSYRRSGLLDARSAILIALAGFPFTLLGAWFSDRVGGRVVLIATAVLIGYMAFDMLRSRPAEENAESRPAVGGTLALVTLGAITGLYSGFLGLGGGFVIVPALTRYFRMPVKRAIGTSLMAVALLAVPGTFAHWRLGHIDVELALALMIGVVPGALIGARWTRVSDEGVVRFAFAGLLVLVAGILVAHELGFLG